MVKLEQIRIGTIIKQAGLVGVIQDLYTSSYTGKAFWEVRFIKNAYLRQPCEKQDFDMFAKITEIGTPQDLEWEFERIRSLAEEDARNMVEAVRDGRQFIPIPK